MTKRWIVHKAKARRYRKRTWRQRHKTGNHIRKNYGATYEIKRVFGKPGRKTQLLILREDIEENLQVPDIPEQRKLELEERKEEVNQQLKRIQGRPPTEFVRGEKQLDLKLGLLERFKGTSSRRPEFIEKLNLPLKETIPRSKEELRKKAMEHFGIKKGLDILHEKSLAEAVKGKETSQISLKDLKKYKRMNFGSNGIRLINPLKFEFGSIEWQDAIRNNVREKIKHKEELSGVEKSFLGIQHQHNIRHNLYKK